MRYPQPNDGFEWVQAPWGRVLRCRPLASAAPHFFTGRELALTGNDGEWRQVAAFAGVAAGNLLLVKQVHGASVALADAGRRQPWTAPEADAIATDDPQSAVAVRTADCVPILVADETGRAVAAIHAGWRGLAARAPVTGVSALVERYGLDPERLIAAIGPAIGSCCYEVGPEVRDAFDRAGHDVARLERWFEAGSNGKFHLDTWRAAIDQLQDAGMNESRIHAAGLCTLTHADAFHSYRAAGRAVGRMVALVRARP